MSLTAFLPEWVIPIYKTKQYASNMQTMKDFFNLLMGPFVGLLLAAFCTPLYANPEGIAFFEQKVRPVLVQHCYSCHSQGADKLKGNLYLDSKAGWAKGGDSGEPVIVPGMPNQSLLIRYVQHLEPGLEMPPGNAKLPDEVIADLVTWVEMGAPDPREGMKLDVKRSDKTWWSLQPIAQEFEYHSIDGFITAELSKTNLAINPPADPRSLIRRMTYDMIGLPPSMEEVDAFVRAYETQAQQAVESLVDRLLASPHYGEHWGRHWLDVIRFGESNGFERNFLIDDLWPLRDYVIRSLNEDKPFNQFIVEHLAGDVIGKDQPEVEIGSAFLVAGPFDDVGNQDIAAKKNIRAATLDEVITTTSGAFLGLTVNCARCHNHKFDPIPTEDYYRLRAAFEGVKHGRRTIATAEQQKAFSATIPPLNAEKERLSAERSQLDNAITARAQIAYNAQPPTRPKVDPLLTEETFEPVEARYVKLVILASTSSPSNGYSARLTEFEVWTDSSEPQNVALAKSGAKAEGARSMIAEDFPEAYGPQFCIDGQFGEQWFVGAPSELTITLPASQKIRRIVFSNANGRGPNDTAQGAAPCEYEIQVSSDGEVWKTVASGTDREPWTPAHGIERARRTVITPEERQQLAALDQQLSQLQARINNVPALPQVWAGNFSEPTEPTFVHKGGDPLKPGDSVVPASLNVLDQATPTYALPGNAPEGERRLALAKWITRNDNPLTPRVLANRVWQYHFGVGLVDTPSDFGFLGSKPTHPQLLDYLASRLIANDWKIKPLHREILLSKTYLQSTAYRVEAAQQDRESRLLWRFPPRRLSAEELRDTLLMVSGKLQLKEMGGPGFRLYKYSQNNVSTYFPLETHGPDTYRRAVYHQNARASIVDILSDFDLPDIAFAAPKRANTTTPLQALTLLNHSFTFDMARALASRIDHGDAVGNAYALVLQRPPTETERFAALRLIERYGLNAFCRALLNSNELLYLD